MSLNKRQKKKFYNKFEFKTYKRSKKYKSLRDLTWVCVKGAEVSNQKREITIEFQAVNFDSPELNQKADMLMKQYEMIRRSIVSSNGNKNLCC